MDLLLWFRFCKAVRCSIKVKYYHNYLLLIAMQCLSCNTEFKFDLSSVTLSRMSFRAWKADDFAAY